MTHSPASARYRTAERAGNPATMLVLAAVGYAVNHCAGPGRDCDYRDGVSVWFRGIFRFSPHPELMAAAPLGSRLHGLAAFFLVALWPFTRLVHVFGAPLGYLTRPYIVNRSRVPGSAAGHPAAAGSGQDSPRRRNPSPRGDVMLSAQSRSVVEATLPVVAEHIGEIAERFYRHLFSAHPELMDGTFNRGNQVDGSQQQALAGSVAAFASALVNTPDHLPENLLSRIAHKHASLGIRPDQYQVVHDHLMWAIGDVLGDAVTPEIAAAWDEVYWLMAHALINQERGLYSARGVRPQTVWRQWEVEKKIRETADVVTFVVKRIDDRLVKTSLPGQYVTVQMPMPDGVRQPRQYSLTRADDGEHRQFSVKWVHGEGRPDGEVSTLLYNSVDVGDVLTMSLPYGDVVLDDSGRPVVFASAGIGITPMAGMLSHLVTAGSRLRIMLLHADLNEDSFALRRQVLDDIDALANASIQVWYEQDAGGAPPDGVFRGMMDISQVSLPDDAAYYLCGPLPFLQAVRSALIERGVQPRDIQYEVFGPDLWQADLD